MAGYLAYFRDIPRHDQSDEIDALMRRALDGLRTFRVVKECSEGDLLAAMSLTHLAFDEPVACAGGLLVQFTYHFGKTVPSRDVSVEVRGSGLAWIDDFSRVRLDDVDAERFCLAADDQLVLQAVHAD